jgi:hypothetical protein
MTKEAYLELAASEYEAIHALQKHDNFYDYEKEYVEIIQRLGRQILEKNLGEVPKDRRKKKL